MRGSRVCVPRAGDPWMHLRRPHSETKRRFAWPGLLVGAALAACVALPPRTPPRIDVVGVALDRVEGLNAHFTVVTMLANDGTEDLVVRALDGRLSIEGEEVAQATLASVPIRVAAHGSARAELASRIGMDALLRAVAAAMRRGATMAAPGARPTLRYSIEGTATLESGYRMHFARQGEIGEPSR